VLVISFLFLITSSFNFPKTLWRRRANMEAILCLEVPHLKTPNGCNYNQMSQLSQRTQGLQSFFWSFSFFHKKDFLDEIFYNMLLKIYIIFSIHHNFLINFWWITKNFSKVYKFYQILHVVLKFYLNFKLYTNMLIISWIVFLYHKIQLFFRFRVHYTLFTCGKGLLKL
jgi:hypothetical protein